MSMNAKILDENFIIQFPPPSPLINSPLNSAPGGRRSTQVTDEKKNNRRSVRRSRAGPAQEGDAPERQGSILRRRKTSTGRRLGSSIRIKMPDEKIEVCIFFTDYLTL